MRYRTICPALVALTVTLSGTIGCQTTGSYLLSTIGLQKKPLAVALVLDQRPAETLQVFNPFPRYTALQKAMAAELDRPVAVDPCFAFQAQQGLGSGWYAVAVVTPTQFAQLPKDQSWKVLAIPADPEGHVTRSAVLVVPADSRIMKTADLRGKKVAFGPQDDARTHHAALQLLNEAGLEKTDLSLEALPVLGSLKHMPDMRSLAQSVLSGSADAGFIDEAEWNAFPAHDDREREPARDKLRVIARTVALPSKLLIASPKLDDATTQRVREFLLDAAHKHPEVLEPLGISAYRSPIEETIARCRELRVGQPPEQPQKADDVLDTPAKELASDANTG